VTPGPAEGPPLARLFAIGYRVLIDGLHDRLREQGWTDVRPAYGFVLLAARDQPTSVTEVAALMGITKQAASKLVTAMMSDGYLERADGSGDRRQRPATLTRRGAELLSAVERIYGELEDGWAQVIGAAQVRTMRADLIRVLADPADGQLPPVRPAGLET
jgi:DNA-binding MarR family transcriptional regulator